MTTQQTQTAPAVARDDKQLILVALRAFIKQRPGLDYRNYGDAASYRADMRGITRALADYWQLETAVMRHNDITAQSLLDAARDAFSGRLSIDTSQLATQRKVNIEYCTGQYWPTEFRNAACAVLASALWHWQRTHAMPTPFKVYGTDDSWHAWKDADKPATPVSAGEWLRRKFKREFGRGIQSRWFS